MISTSSVDSVIYISSSKEENKSDSWESDWSTDTKQQRDVIEGRVMTVDNAEEETVDGPSTSQTCAGVTRKHGKYISTKNCV